MGFFDNFRQPRTDQEVASSGEPPSGFFAQAFAARGMPMGGRRAARQKELTTRILNEEMESTLGAGDSVNVGEAVPEAYFSAARRLQELGSSEHAQQLYQAGLAAKDKFNTQAVELDKTRAETRQLDEAPGPFLPVLQKRDELVAAIAKFPEGSPTHTAMQRSIDDLNSQLAEQNAPPGTGTSAGVARIAEENRARAREGKPPLSSGEVRQRFLEMDSTSSDEQAYETYVRQGGTRSKEAWLPEYVAGRSAAAKGGEGLAPRLTALEETAAGGVQQLAAVQNAIGILNEGALTGTGADVRTWTARALGTFLGDEVPPEVQAQAANTDAYIAAVSPLVLARVRALAPVTAEDRSYIERASGGQIAMSEEALRKVLEIAARSASSSIERYNRGLSNLGDEYKVLQGLYEPLPVPTLDFTKPAPKESPRPIGAMSTAELEAELKRLEGTQGGF